MDPDVIRTANTVEERITSSNNYAAENALTPVDTEAYILPVRSQVSTTESSSKPASERLINVFTDLPPNNVHRETCAHETHHHRQLSSTDMSAIRPEVCPDSDESTRAQVTQKNTNNISIDILPPSNPPLPPGQTPHCNIDDRDKELKLQAVEEGSRVPIHKINHNSSFLETIVDCDGSAVIPPQNAAQMGATFTDVGNFPNSPLKSKDGFNRKNNSSFENKSHPVDIVSSSFGGRVPIAAMPRENDSFKKNANTLEYIDFCDKGIPMTFSPQNTTQHSAVTTLEVHDNSAQSNPTKIRTLDVCPKQDLVVSPKQDAAGRETGSNREVGRVELAKDAADSRTASLMRDSTQGLDSSFNSDKLAVATAVDASGEEGPIYEAADFIPDSNTRLYRNRIFMASTFTLLLLIGLVVSVAVVYSTKTAQEKALQNGVIVPTQSPTAERDAMLTQMIERHVLKRNVTLSGMADSDPPLLALDWVLHKDGMQLEATDAKLLQRFTLALLGFQLDYLAWTHNSSDDSFDWLTSTDECEWIGVTCIDDKITSLDLPSTNLIGEIPPEIGNLFTLERLDLKKNCIFGTLPFEMGLLANVYHVDLSHNGLSGFVPDEFFNLSSLSTIDLGCQKYGGRYCHEINCTSSDGSVIDPQMKDSGTVYKIGLEGTFFEKIGLLKALKQIIVMGNSFSGSISPEIQNLENLEFIDADNCKLRGTIPEEVFRLSKLEGLWLEGNRFSGSLPENIGEATALEAIWLKVDRDGNMNGTIPDSLYNLTELVYLSLSGHSFWGEIKTEIGNLKNLEELEISKNNFSGTLPSELGLCEKLDTLVIHDTNFEGTVPDEVCLLRQLNLFILQADCSPENGAAFLECDEDCCTACCGHTSKVCIGI